MKKRYLSFLVLLVLLLPSCHQQEEQDHSLTVKGYMRQGIPPINRPWTNDEFSAAVNILQLIKTKDSLALPRYDSKKSGPLFRHMISMDNLAFLNNDLFSLHDKTFMLQNFLNIEGQLTGLYMNRNSGQQYYSRELIQLYMFAIAITQKMLDLAYAINISENRDARCMKSGLPAVQHLYEKMLVFVVKEQTHLSSYRTDDLEALSDTVGAAITKNSDWFAPQTRYLLKAELQNVAEHTSSEKIKKEYLGLIQDLELEAKDPERQVSPENNPKGSF